MAGRHRCKPSAQREHMGWLMGCLSVVLLAACLVGFVACLGIKLS